jgi:hypothetical protein
MRRPAGTFSRPSGSAAPRKPPRPRFRLQYVTCRQRHCRLCQGQLLAHGPYWFAVGGGPLGPRRYAGKNRPAGVSAAAEATQRLRAEAERARKERRRQRQPPVPVERPVAADALGQLGLGPGSTAAEVKRAYRQRALACHPDRPGGSHLAMQQLNEAYRRVLIALGED